MRRAAALRDEMRAASDAAIRVSAPGEPFDLVDLGDIVRIDWPRVVLLRAFAAALGDDDSDVEVRDLAVYDRATGVA